MPRAALTGKVAIVTGAASGIGKALATLLARRGAIAVMVDRDESELLTAARALRDAGGEVEPHPVDVTDEVRLRRLVDSIAGRHGRLDYMFNNAGIGDAGEFRSFPLEWWRRMVDTNLWGVIYGSRAAFDVMTRQGFGHIVNTSSLAGEVPSPYQAAYCTTKFGVVGLSKVMALEGAALGVKVTVVCPGFVRTGILEHLRMAGADKEVILRSMPPGPVWISAETAALRILRAAHGRRTLVRITPFARVAGVLYRCFPGSVHRLLRALLGRTRARLAVH